MEIIARGQITIWNYKDGDDAYSVILNHDTHAVACDPSGNALGGELGPSGKAVFALSAYKGATKLTMRYSSAASTAGMCAWNFGTISGCTAVQVSGSNEKFYINTMTADSAYVEIVCSVDGKASITKRVTIVKQKKGDTGDPGEPGEDGKQGCMIRPRGTWTAQTQYVYNDQYRDVVIYNSSVYIVKTTHTSAVSFDSSKWEPFNEFINVATSVLLANKGYIDVLGAARLFVGDTNKSTGWEMTNGYIKHTKSGLTLTADGKLYDPDGLHLSVGGKTVQAIVDGAVDEIQIGGRNILLNSGEKIIPSPTDYLVHRYESAVQFKVGEKYTIVVKGSTSVGQRFGIWINGATAWAGQFQNNMQGEASYIHVTMPSNIGSPSVSTVNVYNVPNPNSASKPCEIEWIAMYAGHIKPPMDWTPAAEDLTSKIEENSAKINLLPDQITLQVKKDITGGHYNYISGTSIPSVLKISPTSLGFVHNYYIQPECKGKKILTAYKLKLEGCSFSSDASMITQVVPQGGWPSWYESIIPGKALTTNGEFLLYGVYTVPSNITGQAKLNLRMTGVSGGTATISEMRCYEVKVDSVAESDILPWYPSKWDGTSLSSEIKQTADNISLKVNQVVGGTNLLSNTSFSADLNGWSLLNSSTGMTAKIVSKGGYQCLELWTDGARRGLYAYLDNRSLVKAGDKFTISFDLYRTSSAVSTLAIGLEDGGADFIKKTLSGNLNTWVRLTYTQTMDTNNAAFIIYGAGNAGAVYIKNIKVEMGTIATAWIPSPLEQNNKLLATGIDIFNKKMIFTADNTVIQDNTGKQIAMFTTIGGKPLLKAENIDVDNLKVSLLETKSTEVPINLYINGENATIRFSGLDVVGTNPYKLTATMGGINDVGGKGILGAYWEIDGYKKNSGAGMSKLYALFGNEEIVMIDKVNLCRCRISPKVLKLEYLDTLGNITRSYAFGSVGTEVYKNGKYYRGYNGTVDGKQVVDGIICENTSISLPYDKINESDYI